MYAAVWAVTVLAVGRVLRKAGFSLAWVLAPAVLPVLVYATITAVHHKTAMSAGVLDFNVVKHSESAFLMADAASLLVLWVLFLAFAFADWPARPAAAGASLQGVQGVQGGGRPTVVVPGPVSRQGRMAGALPGPAQPRGPAARMVPQRRHGLG